MRLRQFKTHRYLLKEQMEDLLRNEGNLIQKKELGSSNSGY